MSAWDPAADYALGRLLQHVSEPDEHATALWHRASDGAPVKAVPATWLPDVAGRVDLYLGRPGESLADFDSDTNRSDPSPDDANHRAVPIAEVRELAGLRLAAIGHDRDVFERAASEKGTARDPDTFASIAADYLRTGPPGAHLRHYEQHELRHAFGLAMRDASKVTGRLEAISELLESLPGDVRTALDFDRDDDANIVKFGTHLAQHRVRPERDVLEYYLIPNHREHMRDDRDDPSGWER
jgi:hypothetical protein